MRFMIVASPLLGLCGACCLFGLLYVMIINPVAAAAAIEAGVTGPGLVVGGAGLLVAGVIGGLIAASECKKHGS